MNSNNNKNMETFTFREAIKLLIDYQGDTADSKLVRVAAGDGCITLVELFNGTAGIRIHEHQLWPVPGFDNTHTRGLQDEDALFDGWMFMSDVLPPNFPGLKDGVNHNDCN